MNCYLIVVMIFLNLFIFLSWFHIMIDGIAVATTSSISIIGSTSASKALGIFRPSNQYVSISPLPWKIREQIKIIYWIVDTYLGDKDIVRLSLGKSLSLYNYLFTYFDINFAFGFHIIFSSFCKIQNSFGSSSYMNSSRFSITFHSRG